tara:strand:- start:188563 stop:189303 length:741 start_codon:yes stop_codon:yes gene_type:complete
MRSIVLGFAILLFFGCKEQQKELTAQQIVDKAIEVSGGEKYTNAEVDFTFRNLKYKSVRQNGRYSLQRLLPDTLNTLDIITNEGFTRLQKSDKVVLADTTAAKYAESVNSVHYFIQLPYGLNDEAVQKKLLGEVTLKEKEYYKIEVTFSEDGGGVDFEDIFLYWISKDEFTVDYLAYKFFTDKGGIRFRESVNPRVIEGIRFVDYINYRTKTADADFYNVDKMYEAGELIKLSLIEKEGIRVRLLN